MLHPTTKHRWVLPASSLLQERWDAAAHLGSRPVERNWRSILDVVGHAEEGARNEATTLAWRPSNLNHGVVRPTAHQLCVSPPAHRKAVGPGDVLLSKLLPARAAVVVDATPRLPPDGNCILLRGVAPADGLWITMLYGHPGYQPLVSRICVGATLPRVGVRDLGSLAIPATPAPLRAVAERWREAANAWTEAERGVAELLLHAQALVDDAAAPLPDARDSAFVDSRLIGDSWVPEQVALARYRVELAALGWRPLADELVVDPPRLREELRPLRLLRLSDADDTFGFAVPPVAEAPQRSFRVYAAPMRPDEVLLSTLGSASKVVVNHPANETNIWLSDQWIRLRSTDTMGAVALLLTTSQVRWQLERAATGVVRQFVSREDLGAVLLPRLKSADDIYLHARLLSLLEARADANKRLDVIRADVGAIISRALVESV